MQFDYLYFYSSAKTDSLVDIYATQVVSGCDYFIAGIGLFLFLILGHVYLKKGAVLTSKAVFYQDVWGLLLYRSKWHGMV